MTNDISINVTEVDIQRWMDQALDDSTWGDTYTIYDDGTITVEVELESIDTQDNKLIYRVYVEVKDLNYLGQTYSGKDDNTMAIKRDNYTLNAVRNSLIGRIRTGIRYAVRYDINSDENYKRLLSQEVILKKQNEEILRTEFMQKYKSQSLDDDFLELMMKRYVDYHDDSTKYYGREKYKSDRSETISNHFIEHISEALVIKEE